MGCGFQIFEALFSKFVVVDKAGFGVNEIGLRVEVVAGGGDSTCLGLVTVGQVTTVGEGESHKTAAWGDERRQDGEIGRGAREGLDVDGPVSGVETESLKCALLTQPLNLVDVLVAAIISFAGLAFGILVAEAATHALHHRFRREILTGN